jgi:hypothetical protein
MTLVASNIGYYRGASMSSCYSRLTKLFLDLTDLGELYLLFGDYDFFEPDFLFSDFVFCFVLTADLPLTLGYGLRG